MLYEDYANEQDTKDDGDYGASGKINDYLKDNLNKQAENQAANASQVEAAGKVGGETAGQIASEAAGEAAAAGATAEAGAAAGTGAAAGSTAAAGATAEAGAAAGAGAAGGPIGIAIALALAALGKAKNEVESIGEKGTSESDYGSIFKIFIFFFFIVVFIMSVNMLKITPGSNESYKESSYSKKEGLNKAENTDTFTSGDYEKVEKHNYENPLEYGATEYINNEEFGFETSLDIAISETCHDIVKELGHKSLRRIIENYDRKRSLRSFYNNPWPYDLQMGKHPITPDNPYPCIGDVIKHDGKIVYVDPEDYASYDPKYNDVNYAEVLSIFGQNETLNWKNCTLEDFHATISSDRAKNLYYEMKVEWVVVYKGTYTDANGKSAEEEGEERYATEDEACHSPETKQLKYCIGSRDSYYCDITIKPFGLRELYSMSEVDPEEMHNDYENFTNYDMLDRHELYERTYIRKAKDILGPSYDEPRNAQSTIYKELIEKSEDGKATGRSAWYYISYDELYEEQKEFIENFEHVPETPILSPELLELLESLGIEDLEDMPYYFQSDFLSSFGSSTIAKSGCGVTSMAMIASYLTGKKINPDIIGSNFGNYYVTGQGMSWGMPSAVANYFGFKVTTNATNYNTASIISQIKQGNPVMVSFKKGKFTSGGHLCVISGVTDKGFIVHDPNKNNKNKYGTVYSFSDVELNSKAFWSFSK